MSAAYPEVTPHYSNISPLLAEAVHENLNHFAKLTKTLIELTQKVSSIHDDAANSILMAVDVFGKKINEISKNKYCQNDSFVKFINRVLEQLTNQAQILQSLRNSFGDCVVVPLQHVVEQKKEVWKTCFHYAQTFQGQIRKKEDDLIKRHKDYSDSAMKLKSTNDAKPKLQLFYNNSHNTYLLRLSSVNSINNLLYTHVLPHVMFALEKNQGQLNDSLRHHIKYMFSVQKDTLKKLTKSVDKMDYATDKIDIVSDLKKFIKSTVKGGLKDWTPPTHGFSRACKSDQRRGSILVDPVEDVFIVNKLTQPNLHRRLASLQYQTNQLVDSISSMRAGESQEIAEYLRSDDDSLNELIELLCICDKEANLNVLLKQMELYTSSVLDYLGPPPDNILHERKHTKISPTRQAGDNLSLNNQRPHEFIESRLIKPLTCYYCNKIILLIGKGFTCKTCKMSVHKKNCATNVPFCDGIPIVKQKQRSKSTVDSDVVSQTLELMKPESSVVYDLIDFEDEDSDGFFDEDEFDDGLSDEDDDHDRTSQYKPRQRHSIATTRNPTTSMLKPTTSVKPNVQPKSDITPPVIRTKGKHTHQQSNHHRYSLPVLPVALPHAPLKPIATKPTTPAKPTIGKKPTISKKPSLTSPLPKQQTSFCVALYDFHATQNTDLSLTAGAKVKLVDKSDADWWKGELDGNIGFFPSQYVLEVKETDTVLSVLYDFQSQNKQELSIKKGQILVLLEPEDDWYKVKSINGIGLIPVSYVESL